MNENQRIKLKEKLEDYIGENLLAGHEWESLIADIEEILDGR